MTSIQAMRWFYRRLLDAPQMPSVCLRCSREGLRFGKSIQAPERFLLLIGGINLEELAESRWPRLRTNIRHARERLSADYSRPHTATMLGADLGM